MTRLRLVLLGTALMFAGLAGCRQHCFMTEDQFRHYRDIALSSPRADHKAGTETDPAAEGIVISTVLSPEARKRPISLAECVALALENGRTGEFFDRGGRRTSAAGFVQREAPASGATDSIRVFSYDPALFGTELEASLAKFDTFWRTSMTWNKLDRPVGTALETFQAGAIDVIDQDTAEFRSELFKPLPTGGVAGISFRTEYDFSNLQQRVNPAYRPAVEFSVEQPLLQGAGVFINQIRRTHPGSIRTQLPVGGGSPGILLVRLDYEQAQIEFERRIHELLFAVEEAYWELYSAYWELYSRETAMRQAYYAWHIAKANFDVGKMPITDFKQVEQQFHLFRSQRLDALGRGTQGLRLGVLEAERRLRYITGLPYEDGSRLVPSDTPTITPLRPDWSVALSDAMGRRPELVLARMEVQAARLALIGERDSLWPDVRAFGTYDVNGLGRHLDGKDEDSALRNLSEGRFNDWTIGLRMDVPIGFREAHARVTRSRHQLQQRVYFLQDQESKVAFNLQRAYRDLTQLQEQIMIQRARRLAATEELSARFELFKSGKTNIDVLLEAQRNWADALRDEHFAITDYNVALVDFERQKGTILQHHRVTVMEGPLPECAQSRASEHIRERLRSIVLKESGQPAPKECDNPAACSYETGDLLPESSSEAPNPLPNPNVTDPEKALTAEPAPVPQLDAEPKPLPERLPKAPQAPEAIPEKGDAPVEETQPDVPADPSAPAAPANQAPKSPYQRSIPEPSKQPDSAGDNGAPSEEISPIEEPKQPLGGTSPNPGSGRDENRSVKADDSNGTDAPMSQQSDPVDTTSATQPTRAVIENISVLEPASASAPPEEKLSDGTTPVRTEKNVTSTADDAHQPDWRPSEDVSKTVPAKALPEPVPQIETPVSRVRPSPYGGNRPMISPPKPTKKGQDGRVSQSSSLYESLTIPAIPADSASVRK